MNSDDQSTAQRDDGSTVVVGAAGGMGGPIAERLGREPWCGRLVVADLNEEAVTQLAADLRAAGVPDVAAHHVDITDPSSLAKLVDAVDDARRLVVTVGVMVPSVSALETTVEDFERTLAVNLTGAFSVSQAFAQRMVQHGDGAIVAISSIASIIPRWRQVAYSASKAGLAMALRGLGLETMEHGVRVNVISPGGVDTPMSRAWRESQGGIDLSAGDLATYRTRVPAGRSATPAEIAGAVAFMLGPDSRHIALRELVIDGGELLGA
jgi:2,3-dihydro-2,3-dihydroxybenzoate dehydrogenase